MVIRIPIEVQTSESTEIRSLLDRIDQAESKLQVMRTATQVPQVPGRADLAELIQPETGITRDTSRISRSALGVTEAARTTPIGTPYLTEREKVLPRGRGAALPGTGAPQDLVKSNEFRVLQQDVFNLEQEVGKFTSLGSNLVGIGTGFLKKGTGLEILATQAAKILPPLLIAYMIKEVAEGVLELMFMPGGPWDRRFKRDFMHEYNVMRSREQKGQIRTGQQEIRITTGPIGKRVRSYDIGQTLTNVKSGVFPEQELSYAGIGER